jgi:peptide methionine sulfoxide reductase MsrA
LLEVFFVAHDPTQVDGQGGDIGSQYLSGIFYLDEHQRSLAVAKIKQL